MNTTDKIMAHVQHACATFKPSSLRVHDDVMASLREAIEALVRDAERYRFAIDDRSFAVCKFDDEKRRWVPIRNNETVDAAMQEKQS